MAKRLVTIDVVSDVACPWCYLGKHRLERAIAMSGIEGATVTWRPFRLDPSIPPEGMDRQDYIVAKFGSADALDGAHARLEEMGRADGIAYRFDLISRSVDTTDAHRLVRWSAEAGVGDPMVERLFAAYFSEGKDIGQISVLSELAGAIGLPERAIAERLEGNDDRAAVLEEIEEAYRLGITGVPTFILNRRYAVVGAQSAETLARAIVQIAGQAKNATPA